MRPNAGPMQPIRPVRSGTQRLAWLSRDELDFRKWKLCCVGCWTRSRGAAKTDGAGRLFPERCLDLVQVLAAMIRAGRIERA